MLSKNSAYYTKTITGTIWSVLNRRKVRLFIFGILLSCSINPYEIKQDDYVLLNTMGSYYLYQELMEVSRKYNVDPLLVASVIVSESSSYQFAVSNKNARGLMQVMPETALLISKNTNPELYKKLKTNEGLIYDPKVNMELAVIHLTDMYRFMYKRWDFALHIYNLSVNSFNRGQRNYSYVNGILNRVKTWKNKNS